MKKPWVLECNKIRMKGNRVWNKGLKGLQPWHNIIGLREKPWNKKGNKLPKTHPFCQFGEKHPCWVNGNYKKRDERWDSAYHYWIKQVKKRDNNQCIFKGQNCSGYNVVHHILPWRDFPELRYELKNGITLCQFHHPRKRIDEKRLIPFFQEMVGSKELI